MDARCSSLVSHFPAAADNLNDGPGTVSYFRRTARALRPVLQILIPEVVLQEAAQGPAAGPSVVRRNPQAGARTPPLAFTACPACA